MTRVILALLATTSASPALAQHSGHSHPSPPPTSTCTPEHAAMGHCTIPTAAAARPVTPPPAPAPAPSCTPEHVAMGHCTMPPATRVPAATPPPSAAPASCPPEHAAMGHCKPAAGAAPPASAADPHAGHQMGETAPAAPPFAPPPAEAMSGPAHAQDLFFNPADAARSRALMVEEHGGMTAYKFLIDQLEVSFGEDGQGYSWDAQFWYGGDIDKFWLKTEGEGTFDQEFDGIEIQGLWSHAIDPWFDVQAGVRQDIGAGPDRTHLVVGFQGLAPYWFEVEGAVFLSTQGDITARVEAEYDLRLTQELILQPKVEVDFSLQDVPELQLGSGITTAELGARLRYEFFPRSGPAVIAPYIGVMYERAFGRTEDFRLAEGEGAEGVKLLVGVRTWF